MPSKARVLLRKIARHPTMSSAVESLRREKRDFLLGHLPRGSVGAEIGTHEGDFAARILHVVRPQRIHLIDPWLYMRGPEYETALYGGDEADGQKTLDERYLRVCRRFAAEVKAGRVVIHRSASTEAAQAIEDGSLDWVYVDGNHLYEYVRSDLAAYRPKLRHGGYLAGDDYGPGGWWQGGVKRAVDEFVEQGQAEVVLLQDGQFLLRC